MPWSSIRRQEMYTWIYWSVFNAPIPETIPPAHQSVLDEVLEMIHQRSGCQVLEGSSGVPPMRLTVDPIIARSRPLAWYGFVALANLFVRRNLQSCWSAQFGTYDGLDYMLRVPSDWNPETGPRPIVLLHGLGLGLTQYNLLLSHLLRTLPGVPLLVPLQPHISQDIFHPRYLEPPDRQEKARCVASLLEELGWVDPEDTADDKAATPAPGRGVTVLSHSKYVNYMDSCPLADRI